MPCRLDLDGSDLQRAQDITSHLRDVSVAIIPEGAAFSFLSTFDWNKVAFQGGRWLLASPGFQVGKFHLSNSSGSAHASFSCSEQPGNPGWHSSIHPRARQQVTATQLCVVRGGRTSDRQNSARETQPPGSPSARRVVNHCLLGKRTTLPHILWHAGT